MKKIMFYCHVFYPQNSGYSNAFQNLIYAILDYYNDIEITVITPFPLGKNNELIRERLNIIRLNQKARIKKIRYFLNDYFYAKEVSTLFKKGRFDFLFIETFDQAIFINSLDHDLYSKTLVRVHSTNETEYTFFDKSIENKIRKFVLKRFLMNKVVNIASTNKYHIDFVKKYYLDENIIDIANKKFFIIPNTIHVLNYDIDFSVGEKIKIFTLGRMDRLGFNQKGFSDLAYAFRLLEKEKLNRFEVTIVGVGEEKYKIENLLKEFPNIKLINSLDHQTTIKKLIESDVVILPSRYEGLSMFALEAIATGNLVLFSKTGGLIDLVDGNGFLFNPQNIEELANCIKKVIEMPIKDIIRMKRKSIELFEEKFSPPKVAEKFIRVLEIIGNN